jgi:hypothetical protein
MTMSGRRLVCFVGNGDEGPGVSDSAPETVHQIASDMNKSKRMLSANRWVHYPDALRFPGR